MSIEDVNFLEKSKYISLSTRKRSGDFVATPVWFAQDGDNYYIFTDTKTGKYKRLRNFSEVRIAPCTYPGKITGAGFESAAFILESPDEIARATAVVKKKYGMELRLVNLLTLISRRTKNRVYIRIDAAQPQRVISNA
jgi:uncharacterized protein